MTDKKENTLNDTIFLISDNNIFVTNEYIEYLYANQIEPKNIIMCEYLGLFCQMNDVVKITDLNSRNSKYVAPGDEYEPYYYELKYPGDTYPWRDEKGSLKYIYNEFEKKGVELSTTMYKDIKNHTKIKRL